MQIWYIKYSLSHPQHPTEFPSSRCHSSTPWYTTGWQASQHVIPKPFSVRFKPRQWLLVSQTSWWRRPIILPNCAGVGGPNPPFGSGILQASAGVQALQSQGPAAVLTKHFLQNLTIVIKVPFYIPPFFPEGSLCLFREKRKQQHIWSYNWSNTSEAVHQ